MTDIATFIRDRLDEDEQWAIDTDHAEGMLPEVQAKAGILDVHLSGEALCDRCAGSPEDCPTLRWLAYPYAEHPSYSEAWLPPKPSPFIRMPESIAEVVAADLQHHRMAWSKFTVDSADSDTPGR